MRAYPVIVLEMGTRHGHQVNRPLAPINQTGRSRSLRVSSFIQHTALKERDPKTSISRAEDAEWDGMFTASLSGRRTLHLHPGL